MSDATLPQPDANLFRPENESKSMFVKWGKINDWVKGTLHEIRHVKSTLAGQEEKLQTVYDFIAHSGVFHDAIKSTNEDGTEKIDYRQIVLNQGQLVSLGGNQSLDTGMRPVKIGQVFGVRFSELKPAKTKGFAAQKVRKVYPGEMDPTYAGGMSDVASDPDFTK